MDDTEIIPEGAVQVGVVEVQCAQCDVTCDVPVHAWIIVNPEDDRFQSLATRADMAELWSHVWSAHS